MDWPALAAGGVAGVSLSVIGHPFDTVKTRMQTDAVHRSAWRCAGTMVRNEGLLSIFKGLYPAVVAGALTSSARCSIQSWVNTRLARTQGANDFEQLGLWTRTGCETAGGCVTGLFLPFIFTPLEMVKCRQQVHVSAVGDKPKGTLRVLRDVFRAEGVRGVYVGHGMTTLRSIFGNASLFGGYVVAKELVAKALPGDGAPGTPSDDAALVRPLAGILAGWFCWLVTFPLDAAKTRMQVETQVSTAPSGVGARVGAGAGMVNMRGMRADAALLQLYREGALYRGIGPVLARAAPVHMSYLPVFDWVVCTLREHTEGGPPDS